MKPDEVELLRSLFQALAHGSLEPGDPRYVPLYEREELAPHDPVKLLARAIEWMPAESVQLFSGFRGTGKSTELMRLKAHLDAEGYQVVLIDSLDYLDQFTPPDLSDFLMMVAGGFSERAVSDGLIAELPGKENFWDRFLGFARRVRVDMPELKVGVEQASVTVKTNLKSDSSFRAQLQAKMRGHIGPFVEEVRDFLAQLVKALLSAKPESKGVVLLVDSVEQIRGVSSGEAQTVQSALATLFGGHADKLRIPNVHVVYTVPPYLKVLYPGLGAQYEPGEVQVLPTLKVRTVAGERCEPALDALAEVVDRRGEWERLLGSREVLDELSLKSGGYLRDLFRFVADTARRAERLPVDRATVDRAIEQVRSDYLPISAADSAWLAEIARTREAQLPDVSLLPRLAHFLDTHVVHCYRNGEDWYDIHPLIKDDVLRA